MWARFFKTAKDETVTYATPSLIPPSSFRRVCVHGHPIVLLWTPTDSATPSCARQGTMEQAANLGRHVGLQC